MVNNGISYNECPLGFDKYLMFYFSFVYYCDVCITLHVPVTTFPVPIMYTCNIPVLVLLFTLKRLKLYIWF